MLNWVLISMIVTIIAAYFRPGQQLIPHKVESSNLFMNPAILLAAKRVKD
jgi:hypothetical protein